MRLLPEDSSLKHINEILNSEIPQYRILGDLPLDQQDFIQLANRIGVFYDCGANQQIFLLYKESLAVFLVFCAVYEYDDRTFWKSVEKYIGEMSIPHRNKMFHVFLQVLDKYNLELFESESEEGYAHVTPILCHAGIPINALDSFFTAISNTVNDSFYDDFSVNDYLSYFKNKTEITVRRYLKLNSRSSAYQFIQNVRSGIIGTVEEHIELTGNELRMISQVDEWKEKPKVKKSLNARQNVRISAPKIKVDIDGFGVFFELPQIMIKQSYDPYVIWEIQSDEKIDMVKASIYRRDQILYSEEKELILRPASNYCVTLKIEDNIISKWEYKGVQNSFIAFQSNGSVIKDEYLINSTVILLLKNSEEISNKESLSILELPSVPFWNQFSTYKIDLSNEKVLICSSISINIVADKNPSLLGGEKLFSQMNTDTYTKLPYFKIPVLNEDEWHFEVVKKYEGSVVSKSSNVLSPIFGRIGLEQIIENGKYGCYQIKVWHHSGVNARYNIEYVPMSRWIEKKEYWPSEFAGYTSSIQALQIDTKVEINTYNAELVNHIQNVNYGTVYFETKKNERFLMGDYKYCDGSNVYTTAIKKSLYPISWGITGVDNELVELTSQVCSFTLNELQMASDPMLYLAFDVSNRAYIQTLTFSLRNNINEKVIFEEFSIKEKASLRIPLNKWIMELQSLNEINHMFFIELRDDKDMLLTAFSVARIQEEVIVSNAKCIINQEEIILNWDEEGTKINRECVLVNFTRPWIEPVYKSIKDSETNLNFNVSGLIPGIYKYSIRKRNDDLFTDEQEDELCKVKEFQSGIFQVKGKADDETDIKQFLAKLLRTRFVKMDQVGKQINELEEQVGALRTIVLEDVYALISAYIVYSRFYSKREEYAKIDSIFKTLFHKFSIYCNEIMRLILESKLSTKFKKLMFHKFYCNNLISVKNINDIQKNMIASIDEDAAGFLFLISGNSRGYSWAGISDISVLREEDLFGDSENSFLSKENMGNSEYISQYFEFVYKSMQKPKNISKTVEEFIREFQNEIEINESLIFGRTRLRLLAEWKGSHKNANEIEKSLSAIIKLEIEENLRLEYKDTFAILEERRMSDALGYYVGLIALYAAFVRHGLIHEKNEFSKLLNYTIEHTEKLYYRDAIIFELYLHEERGLEWD